MRRTDDFRGGGRLRSSVKFYTMNDADGSSPSHSPTRTPVFAYDARASISPFQGLTSRDGEQITVGEVWNTVFIRYAKGRVPVEGMQMVDQATGQTYEVRGQQNIDVENRKVELSCRLIR